MSDKANAMRDMWVDVGLGLNGQVRDMLSRLQLIDPSLRWHEGSGFITRRYSIVGSANSIDRIKRAVAEFAADERFRPR
jgi:hypothetical protein